MEISAPLNASSGHRSHHGDGQTRESSSVLRMQTVALYVSLGASIGSCLYHSNQPAPRCLPHRKPSLTAPFPNKKALSQRANASFSSSLCLLHTAHYSEPQSHPLHRLLPRLPSIPIPPLPAPPIHLPPRDLIPDQTHDHPQLLHILIPRFVIKEQHLLIPDPGLLVQPLEVRLLVPREYLMVVEELGGFFVGRRRRRATGGIGGDGELCEESLR